MLELFEWTEWKIALLCVRRTDMNSNIIAVKWYDNKAVNLISSFVGVNPVDTVKRYDRSKKTHVLVDRPNIVRTYNQDGRNWIRRHFEHADGIFTFGYTL